MGMSVNFHADNAKNFEVETAIRHSENVGDYTVLRLFAGEMYHYQEINLYLSVEQLQELKRNVILLLDELTKKEVKINE